MFGASAKSLAWSCGSVSLGIWQDLATDSERPLALGMQMACLVVSVLHFEDNCRREHLFPPTHALEVSM